MNKKKIQIPESLFLNIIKYFIFDIQDEYIVQEIKRDINIKLDMIAKHDLYTQFKAAATEEKKEIAKQKYLDHTGIFDNFHQ